MSHMKYCRNYDTNAYYHDNYGINENINLHEITVYFYNNHVRLYLLLPKIYRFKYLTLLKNFIVTQICYFEEEYLKVLLSKNYGKFNITFGYAWGYQDKVFSHNVRISLNET